MKVASYSRTGSSDADQTLGTQLARLREYCHNNGLEIEGEYADNTPGAGVASRRAWDRMIEDAKIGKFNVVIVLTPERITRSKERLVTDIQGLENYGVIVIYPRDIKAS
jgi:site-specific DNA recombinase